MGSSGHRHAPVVGQRPYTPPPGVQIGVNSPPNPYANPQPISRGYTVSPTGQLLPDHPNPYDATMAMMNGTPEAPNESQLMQAARDRMQHHISTKEMLTKHQLQMQKLQMQAAQQINRHRMAV
jgi:hypothetical protein